MTYKEVILLNGQLKNKDKESVLTGSFLIALFGPRQYKPQVLVENIAKVHYRKSLIEIE